MHTHTHRLGFPNANLWQPIVQQPTSIFFMGWTGKQERKEKHFQLNLQSRLIPTVRHFRKRQYWQRFLFSRITKQLPSRKHRYSICFCMLRRKKPCERDRRHMMSATSAMCQKTNDEWSAHTYFASLARCYAVMVSRCLVWEGEKEQSRTTKSRLLCRMW